MNDKRCCPFTNNVCDDKCALYNEYGCSIKSIALSLEDLDKNISGEIEAIYESLNNIDNTLHNIHDRM